MRTDARTCLTFVFFPQIDDDNLSKLEKADILELTVNHLTKLHSPKDPVMEAKKFQAGFGQCAAEACRFIMSVPDLDANVSQNLIGHLSRLISAQPLTIQVPERPTFSPPTSPSSMVSDRHHYYSDHDRSSSDAEDSLYSGDSKWGCRSNRMPHKGSPPTSGLLTTVDKLGSHAAPEQINGHVSGQRNAYFNRVPAEAKDIILQKIRQHIMDKRGNDNCLDNASIEAPEPKYLHSEYKNEFACQYPVNGPSDTLDLRKVRSPTKAVEAKNVSYPVVNQLDSNPTAESNVCKVEAGPAIVPEQCESAMDYSNLPPKKKRKLIEYEYKKQEAARRQLEAFYAEKKTRHEDGPPADEEGNKWRPW